MFIHPYTFQQVISENARVHFGWANHTIDFVKVRLNCIRCFRLDISRDRILKERDCDIDDSRVYPIYFAVPIFDRYLNTATTIK